MKKIFLLLIALTLFPQSAVAQSNGMTTSDGKTSAPTASPTPEPAPIASPASNLAQNKASKARVTVPPEKANPIRIPRFDKPPVIDGKLDDEVWKQAVVLKDFYQINPGDNIAPSKATEVFIGYDSKFLYFGFHCFDEPEKVRATVAKRDEVFGDDNIRVFLDTFNDQRRAYVLGWNALGIQQDGIMTEGSGTDFSVDIVMESKGMLTSDGWTVEVAIPFKSLRYEAGKGKLWGFHVWRNFFRFNDETDSWVPISRDVSGTLSQEAHLTGLEGISTERTLELIPSLTLSETGKRVNAFSAAQLAANPALMDPGRMLNEPVKADVGLTMKYGITPTVTLDLAINPDFAQVEADQTVVTANQRFPIFFEEKRPFFLEGIDIFQTRLQAVHTRAIVDPDIAVKLTGKRRRNTFGLLLASDNAPGNFSGEERTNPVNFRFLDKNAYVAILRLKHDVGKESSLGFLATSYNFIEKHNQLAGIDGRFKLDKQTTFNFQILGTTSRRCFSDPSAALYRPSINAPCYNGGTTRNFYRVGNGLAYTFSYGKDGRHFYYGANGNGRTSISTGSAIVWVGERNRMFRSTSSTTLILAWVFRMAMSDCLRRSSVLSERLHNLVRSLADQSARRANTFLIHLAAPGQAKNIQSITLWAMVSARLILILARNQNSRAPVRQRFSRDRRKLLDFVTRTRSPQFVSHCRIPVRDAN